MGRGLFTPNGPSFTLSGVLGSVFGVRSVTTAAAAVGTVVEHLSNTAHY